MLRAGGFFSLGAMVRPWLRHGPVWLPWAVAAAGLLCAAAWDPMRRGGDLDFVLLGLAGYELLIGLTEEAPSPGVGRA